MKVMVLRPSLIVYAFTPKEMPSYPDVCTRAHEYLKGLWHGCDDLGIKEALSKLPTAFPQTIEVSGPLFRLVAAKADLSRRANGEDYQAFLFEYQDIFGFVATLESNSQVGSLAEWNSLLEKWISHVGSVELPQGVMEETYFFTALQEGDTFSSGQWLSNEHLVSEIITVGNDVIQSLPGSASTAWRAATPYLTDAGYIIWGGEPLRSRRTAALIAPLDKKDDLFRWSVWPDQYSLAPFAKYLMHGAKLRFAQHVFESDVGKLHKDYRPLDQALTALISLYRHSEDDGRWNMTEITKAHSELVEEQTQNFALLYGISKLKELILTTRIAARNMRKLVPAKHTATPLIDNNIFQLDRARGTWLREQMEMDLGYLAALRERAQEGHKIAALLLERESQRTARRLNSLVLLQGALLGSITIGLLMLPAFDVFHNSHAVVWSVVALLMATALTLPPLFARWHEDYTRVDHIAGGLFCAAAFFFGVTLWEYLPLPTVQVSRLPYLVFRAFVCTVGFLLGYLGVGQMEKLKGKRRVRKARHSRQL